MSERKVLNKYYPPDFDVTKLPKLKLQRERQFVIRIMAPFSMRCKTCGDYIYKGRKFNSRMETIKDETYLGLRKYRFYIKCPKCLSEITFKTDPERTDYEMEHGATRNFQAHKFAAEEESKLKAEKEEEELNNPMKALENRTKESKLEMSRLEDLEDIKEINKRHAVIDHDSLLRNHIKLEEEILAQQEAEDEEMVRKAFGLSSEEGYFKRLNDSDSDEDTVGTTPSIPPTNSLKRSATDMLTTDSNAPDTKKAKSKLTAPTGRDSLSSSLAGLKQMVRNKKSTTAGTSSSSNQATISSSTSTKVDTQLDSSNKEKPTVASIATSANSTSQSAESGRKNTVTNLPQASLTLLGTYNSSSGSSDSSDSSEE